MIRVLNSAADASVTCGHGVSGAVGHYFCGPFGKHGRSCYAEVHDVSIVLNALGPEGKSDCREDGLHVRTQSAGS